MPMQCNIDSKGKAVRLIYGFLLIITGVLLAFFWAAPADRVWPWMIVGCIVASGGFAVFEGWSGWCVIRAMGFKTPL
jgi:uncharacterized BrkB/YihY/UPF0761 family membrane protein